MSDRTQQLGVGVYATTDAAGITVHQGLSPTTSKNAIRLSISDLEELIRVAVRAGLINIGGGDR